jgi:MurNAc alpha-1-phosphate uridylyltransferase
MILAAGRGERMRPLTDHTPKPLLKIGGQSLIERHLERLAGTGIKDVVVNLAWLGDRIERTLADGREFGLRIRYSHEPAGALETAGGIHRALPWLGSEPFLVISGDVLCDYPLKRLSTLEPPGLAHLVLVDNPAHHPRGDFALREGRVITGTEPRRTYAGIGVFRPELFAPLPPGRRALRPVLAQAIAESKVSGELYAGQWADVGTLSRLEALREQFG